MQPLQPKLSPYGKERKQSQDLREKELTQLAIFLFGLLIALTIGQAIYVVIYALAMKRPSKLVDDSRCPKAAVVLCVRGEDPFLKDCLDALGQLDYPDFEAMIIVDHVDDPSWDTIRETTESFPNVQLHTLKSPNASCSLKCSSLVQVISSLDESYEFVALLDSDTIPNNQWLRSLASGLEPNYIGAVTGIRWYTPNDSNWGSLVRYLWNSAAVVQMYIYQIAWGGTLAIKTTAIREANLIQRWSQSFCEDTMVQPLLAKAGYDVVARNDLVMNNRESCNLGDFFHWLTRQLLTARLYHPKWGFVVFHATSTTLANVFAIVCLPVSWYLGEHAAVVWLGMGFLFFQTANYLLLWLIDSVINQAKLQRDEKTHGLSTFKLVRMFFAVPVTQVLYFFAVLKAMALKFVKWRGIQYQVKAPDEIIMTGHSVYQTHSNSDQDESL